MTRHAGARIVNGPSASDTGAVHFDVAVDGHMIRVSVSPLGIGVEAGDPPELANSAVVEVEKYLRNKNEQRSEWYRAAARLRRASGRPPLAGNTRMPGLQISAPPIAKTSSVLFEVRKGAVPIRVMVFRNGGVIDHCDDWDAITDSDRDGAITAALDWIMSNRTQSEQLGLDFELIEEIWR